MIRFVVLALVLAVTAPVVGVAATDKGTVEARVVRLGGTKIKCVRAPCVVPEARVAVSFLRDGAVIARVRSAKDGIVRVRLSAGVYTVRAPELVPLPGGKPRRVRVVAGQTVKLVVPLLAPPATGAAPD